MTGLDMKNLKCISFKKELDIDWLNKKNVKHLLIQAKKQSEIVKNTSISQIIDVLQAVSKSWADPEYHLRKKAAKILPELIDFSPKMIEQGFEVISHICSKSSIQKRIEGEIGSLTVLDGFVDKPELATEITARPQGVLLHLTAGNVFVGAVDSLLCGIVTKNVNILKMSRVDPVFPVLFVQSLKEHDPEGIVWPHQSVLMWKGGDESVENELLQADLTVVFWGGIQALESVKKRLGANTRLIENGPRYSFAVIEDKIIDHSLDSKKISALALDIARWDQQACSSPHVVYILGKNELSVHSLMEELYDELLVLSEQLPVGALSFDEKVEIRKVRELAKMLQAKNEGRLMCPEEFSFTIVYEKSPEFRISCLNRTVFFKLVPDIDSLIEQIKPITSYLQTAGLLCSEPILKKLQASLVDLGITRITDVGGMSEGHEGTPHEGDYLLNRLIKWVTKEYKNCPEGRIEKLMRSALNSEFYANKIKKAGGCNFSNFLQLPLIDRKIWYQNIPPASVAALTGPMTDAYVYASGGTTGEPKFTLYSNAEYVYSTDLLAQIYKDAGLNRSDIVANLFIAGNLWTSFNVAGRALENIGCLHLPVGGGSDIDNIFKYIKLFNVNALVGLPSIIIKLAEEAKKQNLKISIEKILYGGEHLRPQTCEFLRDVFNTTSIRSAGYACVDTGPVGWQCDHLKGTIHHVLEDYSYVEIIDFETLKPATDVGELVVTNLNRTLMPVLRYRTGDIGRWIDTGKCLCGFKGKSFELLGRCDDLMVIGGINLMPVDVAKGLSFLPVGQVFQVVAKTFEGKDLLMLNIESEHNIDNDKIIEALRKGSYKIAQSIDDGWMNIQVKLHKIGQIKPNSRTGKIKVMIDER